MTKQILLFSLIAGIFFLVPELGYCDVEGTLSNIRDTLINRIIPLVGALGLCFAAFSFFTGNPNARAHMWMAILGALIGFGAPSIIDFTRSLVQ